MKLIDSSKIRLVVLGFVFASFAGISQAKTPSFYALRDMGTGGFLDYPYAVSSDGAIVVGTVGTRARMWQDGFITSLGYLPGGASGQSFARGISADGLVIVGDSASGSGTQAFRWENNVMIGLGDLAGGSFYSVAFDVSADGSVIVGMGYSASGWEAFRWENGAMTGLGDLPGGAFESSAYGVSGDGSIVVGYSKSEYGTEAFRWEDGVMTGLGVLPGGTFYSKARGISTDGSVIVGESDSASGTQAFRWENGVMTGLGYPTGSSFSEATGVSADGSVVVGCYGKSGWGAPFIWDEYNGMRNLEYILAKDYGLVLGGWTLITARAISDDGTTIVGYGYDPHGDDVGWLATISPCPYEISGDNNGDCKVDFKDLAIMASHWLESSLEQ